VYNTICLFRVTWIALGCGPLKWNFWTIWW